MLQILLVVGGVTRTTTELEAVLVETGRLACDQAAAVRAELEADPRDSHHRIGDQSGHRDADFLALCAPARVNITSVADFEVVVCCPSSPALCQRDSNEIHNARTGFHSNHFPTKAPSVELGRIGK